MQSPFVATLSVVVLMGLCSPLPARAQLSRPGDPPAVGVLGSTSFLPATFPFEVWDGLIVVKVNVGDGLPATAVVATGLPVCFASPSFAASRSLGADGLRDVLILDREVKVSKAKPQAF